MMNRRRVAAEVTGAGLALAAGSVLMGFLADHHWLIGYNAMLFFDHTLWWVQLVGVAGLLIGCNLLAPRLTAREKLFVGIAFMAVAAFAPILFGGYHVILNVHNWTLVMCIPLVALFLSGALLATGRFS